MYSASSLALDRFGLACVVALHIAAFWGLLQANVIALPAPLAVLTVSLLAPTETSKPRAEIVPPQPKPVERRSTPLQPAPPLAAPNDASAPLAAPPAPTSEAAVAPVAISVPVQAIQPRFDADYLDNPKPSYPPLSRRIGEQGRVVLRVAVDADGRATDVQLHTSSGSPRLDQSALDTVRRWKFVPAKLGKEAIAAWVLVPIAFTLKD